ncbi:MAG: exopolyphosphatase [Abyssibacter sp.]|nr:exopolyphosphatase [Abyssibacter sp.]MCK5858555.1 exopolyphosphatase [Abyssibacter sp.]
MIGAAEPDADVAAVDLGSNSFHMIVARPRGHEITVVDKLREPVRLGAGLGADKQLSPEAHQRAMDCLEQFGQRLRAIPPGRARVVGTNTLRRMRNPKQFLAAAERALGHPVEVISGVEEARLIYGGVVHGLGADKARRLVIDIGGGSTEVIIGERDSPRLLESVRMGCVSYTDRFFSGGEITRKRFMAARMAARLEADYLASEYTECGWDLCIGASGTVRAIAKVIAGRGWADGEITPDGLSRLGDLIVELGSIEALELDGLRDDRKPIFPGGLAVLTGLFDALAIERMTVSDRALREGVIYDLLGRLSDHDVRHDTVAGLARRFGVDESHADHVRATALAILQGAGDGWSELAADTTCRQLLIWAAQLHEIGLFVAHGSYHKHGEYLVRNGDLHGFSQLDQRMLAALVRLHRGKFRQSVLDDVPDTWREPLSRLAIILRLAVILRRGRSADAIPPITIKASGDQVTVDFDAAWLDDHALTRAGLDREQGSLKQAGYKLRVRER